MLLDENLLLDDPACGGGYVALGVREVSPDGRLLAYSADFDGDEVYQLRIRDLAIGTDRPERIERSYYGLAWSADSRSVFYTVTDSIYRPYQVWRHDVDTDPDDDVCVYTEDDERFEAGQSIRIQQIRSAMCAPLWSRESVIGVIHVDSPLHVGSFTVKDLDLLTALANFAAVAIERARLHELVAALPACTSAMSIERCHPAGTSARKAPSACPRSTSGSSLPSTEPWRWRSCSGVCVLVLMATSAW